MKMQSGNYQLKHVRGGELLRNTNRAMRRHGKLGIGHLAILALLTLLFMPLNAAATVVTFETGHSDGDVSADGTA